MNGMQAVRPSRLPYEPWEFDTRYCGKTADEVIRLFKLPSFPTYAFPTELLNKKVEEIHALSKENISVKARIAMNLLNDSKYHNDKKQIQ